MQITSTVEGTFWLQMKIWPGRISQSQFLPQERKKERKKESLMYSLLSCNGDDFVVSSLVWREDDNGVITMATEKNPST